MTKGPRLPKDLRRSLTGLAAAGLLTGSAAAQSLDFAQPADLVEALVVKARTPWPGLVEGVGRRHHGLDPGLAWGCCPKASNGTTAR